MVLKENVQLFTILVVVASFLLLTAADPIKFNLPSNLIRNNNTKTLQKIYKDSARNKTVALNIYRPPRRNDKALRLAPSGRQRVEKPPSSYSWYYLSRRVFYVPLYYQLYFAGYILWVLFRTVRQHKIQALGRSLTDGCGILGDTLDLCETEVYKSIRKYTNLNL